jgi:regulator of sirC expression with transglutaminase-like and TPR domain
VEATDRFRELTVRPEPSVPLDEAALLIAAHAYPDLVVDDELARLDDLAARCYAPTLDALVRHLFVDEHFAGNREQYYDPRNSFLNDVVTRRLGIPITLSALAISVGRRIGVPLSGVGLPGHFLLRDRVDTEVFVDPFDGGAVLDRRGCERAFRRVQGPGAPFDESYLEPVGTLSILARMLANLRAIFSATSDHQSLLWVIRLRTTLPDAAAEERGELAAALAATGSFAEAARELDSLAAELGGTLGDEYAQRAAGLRARLN